MILKTETIKTFLSEAGVVRPNVLYANLADLIKIEFNAQANKVTFTKTNQNVFCIFSIIVDTFQIDDECFIVSEKAINGLAQTTQSETITISVDGETMLLTGGKKENIKLPVINTAEFPNTPKKSDEHIAIDSEMLFCIKVGGNYISGDQKITAASYVHIGPNGVFATNNDNIVYYRKFENQNVPDIFLNQDALYVIKPNNQATYTTQGNYDFINYANGYSFGFIKSVIEKPIQYAAMISQRGKECFEIDRKILLDFCTLVNYTAKGEFVVGCIKFDGEVITLTHDDANFNIHVHKEYVLNGADCDDFNFSIKWLETFLKPLPYNQLTFERIGNHFKITSTEDEQFTSIFAGIAAQ